MRLIAPSLLLLIFLSEPAAYGQFGRARLKTSPNFTIEQLAPGVWAAIHNDHFGKAICNAGILDLGGHTLVYDPFMTPSAAMELRAIAKTLTGRQVSYVVNSHHHTDHIRGNQVFLPNATIIGSKITRELIEMNEPGEQEWEKKHAPTLLQAIKKRMINASSTDRDEMPYWIGYYEGIIESSDQLFTALPDYTFDDSLWIEGSKLRVKLVECRNGHTESDVVLLIPDRGIAFMGDLLYVDRHPWIHDGNVKGWQWWLQVFYEDTAYHTYLPGHGKVAGKSSLKMLYDYFEELQNMCGSAQSESSRAALMNRPIPERFRGWFLGKFYHPNLQFLLSEFRHEQEVRLQKDD